ncbi:hypothetical protein STENM327S_06942 [Streptomyces tendae]
MPSCSAAPASGDLEVGLGAGDLPQLLAGRGLPGLDAAAAGGREDGAAVGLERVHPGVRLDPPEVGALTGVQGEEGRSVGGVDTAVRDRHRPGDVPGLEAAAAGAHVQGVHLEGGDVDQVLGDPRRAPDVVGHPEPPGAPPGGRGSGGAGDGTGTAGSAPLTPGAGGTRTRRGRTPAGARRRRRRACRRRAGRGRWAPGRRAAGPARRRGRRRSGHRRAVRGRPRYDGVVRGAGAAAGARGRGRGRRAARAAAAGRGGGLGRGAAVAAALDQAHCLLGQPRGRRTAVVGAGAEEVRGELGLEVGGVGTAGGLHLHAGLDERAQLVGQALQVGALAQQHEDRLGRGGARGGVEERTRWGLDNRPSDARTTPPPPPPPSPPRFGRSSRTACS